MTTLHRDANSDGEVRRLIKRLAELQGEPKIHGSLCIHFTHGEPKTIEVKYQRSIGD